MNNNQLIIIVIAILVAGGIVGGAIYFSFANQATQLNETIKNNTTNITANLTEDVQQQSSSQEKSDPGAFYSEMDGKMHYTGEVQQGDDDNYWRHDGYNHWTKI